MCDLRLGISLCHGLRTCGNSPLMRTIKSYHIAYNFWGRKFWRISRICQALKILLSNILAPLILIYRHHKIFGVHYFWLAKPWNCYEGFFLKEKSLNLKIFKPKILSYTVWETGLLLGGIGSICPLTIGWPLGSCYLCCNLFCYFMSYCLILYRAKFWQGKFWWILILNIWRKIF